MERWRPTRAYWLFWVRGEQTFLSTKIHDLRGSEGNEMDTNKSIRAALDAEIDRLEQAKAVLDCHTSPARPVGTLSSKPTARFYAKKSAAAHQPATEQERKDDASANFSRMSAAVAVKMDGSGVFIVVVDVVVDSGDRLLDAGKASPKLGGRSTDACEWTCIQSTEPQSSACHFELSDPARDEGWTDSARRQVESCLVNL
jgi:hypothetical protein